MRCTQYGVNLYSESDMKLLDAIGRCVSRRVYVEFDRAWVELASHPLEAAYSSPFHSYLEQTFAKYDQRCSCVKYLDSSDLVFCKGSEVQDAFGHR